MRVMTCNVRFAGASDGPDNWLYRKELLVRIIHAYDPDLIGFQELWQEQHAFIARRLPSHAWFGMADTPHTNRPINAIAWRSDLVLNPSLVHLRCEL